MTKCCINITPLNVPRETLHIRMILNSNQSQVALGGGIKKASKININLIIQNFELNNLTLVVKNAIKLYEYFKNKNKFYWIFILTIRK